MLWVIFEISILIGTNFIMNYQTFSHYILYRLSFKWQNFQFLQEPFILDPCKPHKKEKKSKEIPWTGQINLKKNVWNMTLSKYLTISALMGYHCFPTKKVLKVTFILFCQKNSHKLNPGYV